MDQTLVCISLITIIFYRRNIGEGMLVSDPYFFFIDDSNNLLISDRGSNSILIFNPLFELIHKISVSNNPMGIVIDKQRRIIVVS